MSITTTLTFQRSVLSGVLATNLKEQTVAQRRMNYVALNLRIEHFVSPYSLIFKACLVYFRTVQSIIKYEHFIDLIKRQGLEESEFNNTITGFVELQNSPVIEENEFRYQVIRLKELTKVDRFTETLTDGMDILHTGKKIGNKILTGYDGAITFVQKRLTELTCEDEGNQIGYMNKDITRVIQDYSDRKFNRKPLYRTNFHEIDTATSGGFQAGDLGFIAGYTSEGKSTLLNTLVDNWVFNCKLNVVIATAEHSPAVVQRKMVAIRSSDPKYGGTLDYNKLKEGRLSQSDEKIFERVVQDMSSGPYGNYSLFSISSGATASSIFDSVALYNQIFPVNIFAWDYIGYTQSEARRNTDREEMGSVIRSAKIKAQSFDNRRGIAVISPFQVGRSKWEKAVTIGHYTLSCMAETSEAEKSADIVWSILQLDNKTVGQLLKNRDGSRHNTPFEMRMDVSSSKFIPLSTSAVPF